MTDYLSCGSCPSEFELQEFSHFIEHKLSSSCHQVSPTTNILECLQCFRKFHTSMSLLIHLEKDHHLAIVKIYALPLSSKESEEYNDVIRRINVAARVPTSDKEPPQSTSFRRTREPPVEFRNSRECTERAAPVTEKEVPPSTPFLKGQGCCVKVEMTEEGISYHTCEVGTPQHRSVKQEPCCVCMVRPSTCDQQNQTEFDDLENQSVEGEESSHQNSFIGTEDPLKPQHYCFIDEMDANFVPLPEPDPGMLFVDQLYHNTVLPGDNVLYCNTFANHPETYPTYDSHINRPDPNGSFQIFDNSRLLDLGQPFTLENALSKSQKPSDELQPLHNLVTNTSLDQEDVVYSPFHSSESDGSNPHLPPPANQYQEYQELGPVNKDPLRHVEALAISHAVRFKCEQCGRFFRQNVHLRKHVMSYHDQKKPHKCPLCEYSTVEKSHLTVHLRKHTGEKPFHCRDCEYSSAQNCTLKNHYFRKHPGSRTQCAHCKKEFVTDLEKDNHMKLCQA